MRYEGEVGVDRAIDRGPEVLVKRVLAILDRAYAHIHVRGAEGSDQAIFVK